LIVRRRFTMRSIWKTASVWGLVGVGIAVLFFVFFTLADRLSPSPFSAGLRGFGQDIVLFVWPTSFWLMATEGAGRASTIEIVVMAVLANFVIYFLVGLVLTAAWRAWVRVSAKPSG
jgi:putative effector of murein hydrolase LrgA (UPF0299 family)